MMFIIINQYKNITIIIRLKNNLIFSSYFGIQAKLNLLYPGRQSDKQIKAALHNIHPLH